MRVLITGAAGFIGSHVAERLLARGDAVAGIDNLNAYYDPALKRARLARLGGLDFLQADIADRAEMAAAFSRLAPDAVVHLAAQAGVRHSVTHPHDYADANLVGFLNVLEGARAAGVGHLLFASTSSVYGANRRFPLSEDQPVDHPMSLYAATKKANEAMAHAYAHLYGIPCTGLRFFTVYGPWGRPDMALFKFTRAILNDQAIDIYNHGHMARDFTYIDDIVAGIVALLDNIPTPEGDPEAGPDSPDTSPIAPYRIYNIGNSRPVDLMAYIEVLERCLGREARKNFLPIQPGDVPRTWAAVDRLTRATGYRPKTDVAIGVARFVDWYRDYYGLR